VPLVEFRDQIDRHAMLAMLDDILMEAFALIVKLELINPHKDNQVVRHVQLEAFLEMPQ